METQTVLAVVELKIKANSESDAITRVRNANALDFTKLKELESARTLLVKGIPLDNNPSGISRMLEMAGAALEIMGRKS